MSLFDKIRRRLAYAETDRAASIPEAIKRAGNLGLAGAEINLNFQSFFPENLKPEIIDEWREAVDSSDTWISFHAPVDISLISRHDSIREASAGRMCGFIDLALRLGGRRFTFHPGRAVFLRPSRDELLFFRKKYPRHLTDAFLNSLTEIIKTSYKRIQLLIEQTHTLDQPMMEIIQRFADEGMIAFAYDTAHGTDDSFIDDHLKHIRCCHLNDRRGDRSHLPLGNGEINLIPVIEKLSETDCDFVIETGRYDDVKKSIDFLKSN
jgi:sugar phosphate isomerase/epimerase